MAVASRRQAREYALQVLYCADVRAMPIPAALNELWAALMDAEGVEGERPPESEEVEFAQRLTFGFDARRADLDRMIEEASTNWRVTRMPVVDRNILRIAVFELVECKDIPATVSINESIELAKKYGAADSKAFVNGIVDRIARKLDRISGDRKVKGR